MEKVISDLIKDLNKVFKVNEKYLDSISDKNINFPDYFLFALND